MLIRKFSVFVLFYFFTIGAIAQPCYLGKETPASPMSSAARTRMEADLAEAQKALQANPGGLQEMIWAGRRRAYLGQYQQAIHQFSAAIKAYPDSAAPYRHRGHRYITLRCFDNAIEDFEKAAALTSGLPDEVEPDGMPNEKNIPTSTLQTNIWYHLGLAHFLKGDYDKAVESYQTCLRLSKNPDMYIATANWYHLALIRAGKRKAAADFLATIDTSVGLIENEVYLRLLRLHIENKVPDDPMSFLQQEAGLEGVSYAYGLGAFLLIKGEREKARQVFQHMVQLPQWGAFGWIAAEIDLRKF